MYRNYALLVNDLNNQHRQAFYLIRQREPTGEYRLSTEDF